MINMDQVRTLEMKVKQTVQLIVHLRKENDALRGRLSDTEVRLQELESLLEGLKASQSEMESGIRSALQELDHLDAPAAPESVVVPEPVAAPVVAAPPAPEPMVAELEPEAAAVPETPEPVEEPADDLDTVLSGDPAAEGGFEPSEEDHAEVAYAGEPLEPVTEVELEDDQPFAAEPESETEPEPEDEPQQPGLGIF